VCTAGGGESDGHAADGAVDYDRHSFSQVEQVEQVEQDEQVEGPGHGFDARSRGSGLRSRHRGGLGCPDLLAFTRMRISPAAGCGAPATPTSRTSESRERVVGAARSTFAGGGLDAPIREAPCSSEGSANYCWRDSARG
jgi:hypothetical protein